MPLRIPSQPSWTPALHPAQRATPTIVREIQRDAIQPCRILQDPAPGGQRSAQGQRGLQGSIGARGSHGGRVREAGQRKECGNMLGNDGQVLWGGGLAERSTVGNVEGRMFLGKERSRRFTMTTGLETDQGCLLQEAESLEKNWQAGHHTHTKELVGGQRRPNVARISPN
jgi:hypothetical protein